MNRKYPLIAFVLGLALGIAGTLLAPRFLGDYLPASMVGDTVGVDGRVTAKREMSDRLLLTLDTEQGAVLATFTERVPEITLLVDEGDSVRIGLGRYEPFVTDPALQSVRKASAARDRAPEPRRTPDREPEPAAGPDTLEPAMDDTAATRDTLRS